MTRSHTAPPLRSSPTAFCSASGTFIRLPSAGYQPDAGQSAAALRGWGVGACSLRRQCPLVVLARDRSRASAAGTDVCPLSAMASHEAPKTSILSTTRRFFWPAFALIATVLAIAFGIAWGNTTTRSNVCQTSLSAEAAYAPAYMSVSSGSKFVLSSARSLPLSLSFSTPSGAALPLSAFVEEHASLLHAVLMGSDYTTFAHVHAEEVAGFIMAGAAFNLEVPLLASGKYLLGADALLTSGAPLTKHAYITTSGGAAPALVPFSGWSTAFNGSVLVTGVPYTHGQALGLINLTAPVVMALNVLRVTLSGLPSGAPLALLSYDLTFGVADSSGPVTDLTPFLATAAHIALVRQDLSQIIHEHASAGSTAIQSGLQPMSMGRRRLMQMNGMAMADQTSSFGPNVTSSIVFPLEGWYLLVLQFIRGNATFFAASFRIQVV